MAEEEVHHHSMNKEVKITYVDRVRDNPWILATGVLGILLVIMLIITAYGGFSGGSVSETSAASNLLTLLHNTDNSSKIVSTEKQNGLYSITVEYKNQQIPIFVTTDGKYAIAGSMVALTGSTVSSSSSNNQAATAPAQVPKTAKPTAQFFVFAYCPYGTQMEKALVPVYNLLKDKVDISINFIGAMHGEFEHVESQRQLCIQKIYGEDKLFAYLDKFLVNSAVGSCQGTDTCVNPLIEAIFTQIGVDKDKINSCMSTDGETMYKADEQKASSLGIGGSPTVVINGVEIGGNSCNSNSDCNPGEGCVVADSQGDKICSLNRAPSDLQASICNAFTTAPAECSQALSTASASAGFGSTASSSSAASCG